MLQLTSGGTFFTLKFIQSFSGKHQLKANFQVQYHIFATFMFLIRLYAKTFYVIVYETFVVQKSVYFEKFAFWLWILLDSVLSSLLIVK